MSALLKITFRTGWLLLGAYLTYVLLGELLLNSSVDTAFANRKPEKFRIALKSDATFWPGHVRLTEVQIAGHARCIAWTIQPGDVHERVLLLPLLHKEIRVP